MSFTRQHFTAGQQALRASSFSGLTTYSASVKNWSPTSICPSSVGSRSGQCEAPGFGILGNPGSSNPSDSMPAQIHFNMKIARKDTGIPASDKHQVTDPFVSGNPADAIPVENAVFFEKPAPRQPESPDVESLRSLLNANLPRETASPALLQRIRSRMHDQKV